MRRGGSILLCNEPVRSLEGFASDRDKEAKCAKRRMSPPRGRDPQNQKLTRQNGRQDTMALTANEAKSTR